MKINALIIDDEARARALLELMITEYCPDIQLVPSCADLPNGVKSIRKHKPDLVFLDIEMPGHSGLELLDFFNEDEITFSIIFITAYHSYAIQAFKLSAVDYLLKPIEPSELEAAVERYKKNTLSTPLQVLKTNLNQSYPKKIALPALNSIKFIEIDKILFFKADGAYTHVSLQDQTQITVSKNLKFYEDSLSEQSNFFRCHKSYMVNLNHVTDYIKSDGGYLLVEGKHQISLSSEKVSEFLLLMNKLDSLS